MLRQWLFNASGKLPIRFINRNPNDRYLERYFLFKAFGVTAYLHRFVAQDGDNEVHDHPWQHALSLILCGGYTEERMQRLCIDKGWTSRLKTLKPWRLNVIKGTDFHRIHASKPETWTLFIHTSPNQTWGFLRRTEKGTLYHQPLDAMSFKGWYLRAPKGAQSNRAKPFTNDRLGG